ncbi:hypothetical protein [Hydrogenophaga sp. PAMC20947]|uniref:hypothetical protein n=1 Tax=Hydrogenophaga sp. PAMC20947 TaxID=2565558 RepID=UPI00109D9B27|nr:hypothetical protein [Hydrogenophaga sp. PAMC20947]QCB46630.1 hypothetical protein E5678_11705 [Hydrogenophaga sp. PAMC20947]
MKNPAIRLKATAVIAAIGAMSFASTAFASDLTTEIGARYWHSSGGPEYTLYGGMSTADGAVSALQYKSKNVGSPEVFFRVDHTSGVFVKGILSGTGTSNSGVEYDEDFEPETDPYSRTETSLLKSEVKYGSVDLGYGVTRGALRVGGFVGYAKWNETYRAYGCTQLATSDICSPGDVGDNELGITETDKFTGPRIGVTADFAVNDKLTLSGEAAYFKPDHKNTDNHHLSGLGLTPGNGNGSGSQISIALQYLITPALSIGAGYRVWSVSSDITTGITEQASENQLETYKTKRKGMFLQAAYRF